MKKQLYISVINDLVTDQRVQRVAVSLSRSEADVTLIGRQLKDSPEFNPEVFALKRFRLIFNKGFLFYTFFNLRLFFYLITRRRCDFLVANDLDTLPANYLASKFRKATLIYDSHEYFTETPELLHRKKIRNFWLFLERKIIPRVHYAYTVNGSLARIFRELYGIEFRVVRNVPYLEKNYRKAELPEKFMNRKVIIYQGAINLGRGIENVLKALEYLPELCFIIAGTGDIFEEISCIVKQKGLEDRVHMPGRYLPEVLNGLTPLCDIGISPEMNIGKNYYYALPNKIFNYMHAGIPVLSSNFPEMKLLVEENNIGLTFNPSDINDLVSKLKKMLSDIPRIEKWKRNTKIAAEKYCWENEQNELISIYTDAGLRF